MKILGYGFKEKQTRLPTSAALTGYYGYEWILKIYLKPEYFTKIIFSLQRKV